MVKGARLMDLGNFSRFVQRREAVFISRLGQRCEAFFISRFGASHGFVGARKNRG